MKVWRWRVYEFRDKLTTIAHKPEHIDTWRHDMLEFIAYRVVDPFIWI